MAAKFCETLQSKEIEVYRRMTEVKVRLVIRPIQSLAEKGEHCSGTVMLGPSGKIACVLQRWVKSLVVMKVPRRPSYVLNEYGNGAKRGSRPIGTTEIPLPEEITLPRASDWHRAFVVPGTNKANIARLIVGFVQRTHVELVNRFERHVIGIVPHLIGVAREHAYFQSLKRRLRVTIRERLRTVELQRLTRYSFRNGLDESQGSVENFRSERVQNH